MPSWDRN